MENNLWLTLEANLIIIIIIKNKCINTSPVRVCARACVSVWAANQQLERKRARLWAAAGAHEPEATMSPVLAPQQVKRRQVKQQQQQVEEEEEDCGKKSSSSSSPTCSVWTWARDKMVGVSTRCYSMMYSRTWRQETLEYCCIVCCGCCWHNHCVLTSWL